MNSNNEQLPAVTHRPETLLRIRQVQDWLISGIPSHTIMEDGMRMWNIQKTMMYEYLNEAYKAISETAKPERTDDRQLQIQMLMHLYDETLTQKRPGYGFTALYILKEVAKLKGVYPTRDELRFKENVTISLNLGTASKTGKPEKNEGI